VTLKCFTINYNETIVNTAQTFVFGQWETDGSFFYLLAAQTELYILQNVLTYYHDLNISNINKNKIKIKPIIRT